MIPSHHQSPARFQREQARWSAPLEPSQPVTGWGHDVVDLALAAASVAFLWALLSFLS